MNETTNYNLKQPGGNEYISIQDINDNMTVIDTVMHETAAGLEKAVRLRTVTLPTAGWSQAYPHEQTVAVEGITAESNVKVVGVYIPDGAAQTEVKNWIKAGSCLMGNNSGTGQGSVTFRAYKLPAVDFAVVLEGG